MRAVYIGGIALMVWAWIDFGSGYAGFDLWRDFLGVHIPPPFWNFTPMAEGLFAILLMKIGSSKSGTSAKGGGNGAAGRGSDLRYNLGISLLDAYAGTKREITVPDPILGERRLSVTIPAGVEDGTRIRLAGEGERPAQGGEPGDLYIFVSVSGFEGLERRGSDLIGSARVTDDLLRNGGRIPVQLIAGERINVLLPPNSKDRSLLRVRGKGMPILRSEERGDFFLRVESYEFSAGRKEAGAGNEGFSEAVFEKEDVAEPEKRPETDWGFVDDQGAGDEEARLLKSLNRLVMNKREIPKIIEYYTNKHAKLSRIEVLKLIVDGYERDRS